MVRQIELDANGWPQHGADTFIKSGSEGRIVIPVGSLVHSPWHEAQVAQTWKSQNLICVHEAKLLDSLVFP